MGRRGYFAALKINTLMASHGSDRAQILMIKTHHNMLLYIKDMTCGGSCQTDHDSTQLVEGQCALSHG